MHAQDYMPINEFGMIFGLIDEVRASDSSQFERIPLTTPEACEFMMSKMDETEQSMGQLLLVTQVSLPNLLRKTQE